MIAFTVTHGERRFYSGGERITFDNIITNEGGAYSPGQHEFLCPVTGLYSFNIHSAGLDNNSGITEIWIDDSVLVTALAYGDWSGAGNSAYVRCVTGSRVYVQCTSDYSCVMYGTVANLFNTVSFSGRLIMAEEV